MDVETIETIEEFLALGALCAFVVLLLWLGRRRDAAERRRWEHAAGPRVGPRVATTSAPEGSFRVRIDEMDGGPDALAQVLPVDASYVRTLAGPDRGDYALFRLDRPVRWKGAARSLVILAAQMKGARLGRGARHLRIGVAIVHDDSVERAATLDLSKVDYVAIAEATDVTAG